MFYSQSLSEVIIKTVIRWFIKDVDKVVDTKVVFKISI